MGNLFKKTEAITRSGKQFTENRGYTAHPIHPIQGTPTPPGETAIDIANGYTDKEADTVTRSRCSS